MNITAEDVETALREITVDTDYADDPDDIGWCDIQDCFFGVSPRHFCPDRNWWISGVDEFGGAGLGDKMYMVFRVQHDADVGTDHYYRIKGYYSSYGSSEWDGDLHRVWPEEKTITVWVTKEPKNG